MRAVSEPGFLTVKTEVKTLPPSMRELSVAAARSSITPPCACATTATACNAMAIDAMTAERGDMSKRSRLSEVDRVLCREHRVFTGVGEDHRFVRAARERAEVEVLMQRRAGIQ